MNIRMIPIAVAAVAALSPAFADAAPAAAKACAAAFADSLASQGIGTPKFRMDFSGARSFASQSSFRQDDSTFDLQVIDARSGAPIVRATCSADAHGKVTVVTDRVLASNR